MQPTSQDHLVVPYFRTEAIQDDMASQAAGRPIFRDLEVCEIRIAGDRNFAPVVPAHSLWMRVDGEDVTYAQRWPRQYEQFRANLAQVADGTPLAELPFLTEAKRMELRALKIYTAEALAGLDGANLRVLGQGGRTLKTQAAAYLQNAAGAAPLAAMAAEIEALKAELAEAQAFLGGGSKDAAA